MKKIIASLVFVGLSSSAISIELGQNDLPKLITDKYSKNNSDASRGAANKDSNLENVFEYFALQSNSTNTANDWSDIQKIKGVKWNQSGLQMTSVGFSKYGAISMVRVGKADIFFKGARTLVIEGSVSISEGVGKIFEKDQFDAVLKGQFSATTSIKKLRGGCPGEAGLAGDSLFEVTLSNKKPVYVLTVTDAGGNSPNSRTSSFEFSLQNEQRWRCGR